jgi:hypothetical protein
LRLNDDEPAAFTRVHRPDGSDRSSDRSCAFANAFKAIAIAMVDLSGIPRVVLRQR